MKPYDPSFITLNTPSLLKNEDMPDLNEFVTVQEAAQKLGIDVTAVRRLLRVDKLQGVKVGKTWLVSKDSLKEYYDKTVGDLALDEVMTVQDAAQKLGFNEMSIRRLLRGGKLQGVKMGKTWLVSKESVKEYQDKTTGMSKNDPRRS